MKYMLLVLWLTTSGQERAQWVDHEFDTENECITAGEYFEFPGSEKIQNKRGPHRYWCQELRPA